MRFCSWDYVPCFVVIALVIYTLSGDFCDILGVVQKHLLSISFTNLNKRASSYDEFLVHVLNAHLFNDGPDEPTQTCSFTRASDASTHKVGM